MSTKQPNPWEADVPKSSQPNSCATPEGMVCPSTAAWMAVPLPPWRSWTSPMPSGLWPTASTTEEDWETDVVHPGQAAPRCSPALADELHLPSSSKPVEALRRTTPSSEAVQKP